MIQQLLKTYMRRPLYRLYKGVFEPAALLIEHRL